MSRDQAALMVQKALPDVERKASPKRRLLRRWARAALIGPRAEVTIRLVGEEEGRELNRIYRGKDYATNVLSFVSEAPPAPGQACAPKVRGDIVLCVPVVLREATEQGKDAPAHFAHMVVHGMLHLQGFDHEAPGDAQVMEALETRILATLGFDDPYV